MNTELLRCLGLEMRRYFADTVVAKLPPEMVASLLRLKAKVG